jgi:hypothetical protein
LVSLGVVGYKVINVILNDLDLLGSVLKIGVPRLTQLIILVTTLISILTRLHFFLVLEKREIGVNLRFEVYYWLKSLF